MPCAVIVTALPVEYLAVRTHLMDLKEATHPQGTIYECGNFVANGNSWEVGIVEVGAGNAGAGVEAERAIASFNPSVILFVGVAGGIKDVAIGDVVVATKVYNYESGKAKRKFEPRPDLGLSTYNLIQRSRAESKKSDWRQRLASRPDPTPRVFVAPIVAGEKVIASTKSSVFQFLQRNYGDAVAVEMEGRGFLQAAYANQQVSALVIRGISDLIDGKSEADAGGSQEMAARNASAFAFEILAKHLSPQQLKFGLNPKQITNIIIPTFFILLISIATASLIVAAKKQQVLTQQLPACSIPNSEIKANWHTYPEKNSLIQPTEPIQIKYPPNWHWQHDEDAIRKTIIKLIPQPTNQHYSAFLSISFKNLSEQPLTFEEYKKLVHEQIVKYKKYDRNATIQEECRVTLANREAYAMIYTLPEKGYAIKKLEVGVFRNQKAYLLTYTAQKEDFDRLLPQIKEVISSFKFSDDN